MTDPTTRPFAYSTQTSPQFSVTDVDKPTIAWLLRMFIGTSKIPVIDVSRDTGIPVGAVYEHLDPDKPRMPTMAQALAYMNTIGPAFTNVLLNLINQGGAARISNTGIISAHSHLADVAAHSSVLANDLADGLIDHQERRRLIDLERERGQRHFEMSWALQAGDVSELKRSVSN